MFLLLLGLRLLTWVFLQAPWAGFDEPYHQGLVERWAREARWPSFRSVTLPDRLTDEMRRWPLPDAYARLRPGDTNYETQQSPLYYAFAGRLLRWLPPLSPRFELYFLRLGNALLAFAVGLLAWRCAREVLGAESGWAPVALLALLPGFGLALARVSNDALCALFVALAVAGALGRPRHRRSMLAGSFWAGAAPWAKLYGVVLLPAFGWWILRWSGTRRRTPRLAFLLLPGLALAALSWKIQGAVVPLLYNLRPGSGASPAAVPWLREAWTIAKSHIWISGMSFLVFPNLVYLGTLSILLGAAALSLRRRGRDEPEERRRWDFLFLLLALFAAGLAYNSWRAYGYYRTGGGSGGWYLWAMALPESLWLCWGVTRAPRAGRGVAAGLAVLLLLTVLGDSILFLEPGGGLVLSASRHVVGLREFSFWAAWEAFLASRPLPAALAAMFAMVPSWIVGILSVSRLRSATLG